VGQVGQHPDVRRTPGLGSVVGHAERADGPAVRVAHREPGPRHQAAGFAAARPGRLAGRGIVDDQFAARIDNLLPHRSLGRTRLGIRPLRGAPDWAGRITARNSHRRLRPAERDQSQVRDSIEGILLTEA
jgi:hypothetical protein